MCILCVLLNQMATSQVILMSNLYTHQNAAMDVISIWINEHPNCTHGCRFEAFWIILKLYNNSPPWNSSPLNNSLLSFMQIQYLPNPAMSKQALNLAVGTTFISISIRLLPIYSFTIFIAPFETSFLIKWSFISMCFIFLWWGGFLLI